MKKLVLSLLLFSTSSYLFSQGAQKWSVNGNAASNGDYLGTTNNEPLLFKTNGTTWFKISPNGNYKFHSLSGTGNGMMLLDNAGVAFRFDFSGSSADVLRGDGTWSPISTLTGWNFNPSGMYSTYNIALGSTFVPGYRLTVTGDAFVSGKLSASELEVVDIIFADTIKGGKTFKIRESLCFQAYNINDPNSRNEICAKDNDLYINSDAGLNFNTVFHDGNNGNVGIGTGHPLYRLDVNGNSRITGDFFVSSLAGTGNSILFSDATGKILRGGGIQLADFVYSLDCLQDINGNILPTWNYGAGILYTGGTVCENNVKVGINTDAPLFNLHVIGDGFLSKDLRIGTGVERISIGSAFFQDLGFGTSYLGFNSDRTSSGWSTNANGTNNGGSIIYGTLLGNIHFVSIPSTQTSVGQSGLSDATIEDNTKMIIWNDGRIGVGTTCVPLDQKMAVDGGIICEEVTVKFSNASGCWPDYVFSTGYNLMSLDSLESFIDSTNHLPGIPSAVEVEKNGIELKEIVVKQQEKIEELSLYLIELNKQLKEMKAKLEEIEK